MSKKKQTPAEVAKTLATYMAKQEDTLRSFPVGPMSNTARRNLKKARQALALLQGKNEELRMENDPNAVPMGQMVLGGAALESAIDKLTTGQKALYDGIVAQGASPDAAMAIVSVTAKESNGDFASVEKGYGNTSNKRIREIFSAVSDLSEEELTKLKKDDVAFFNKVYGQRMGNDGEGYKYRGRGLIQLTGKNNYAAVSQALFGDDRLVENPDLITQDETVAGQVGSYFLTQGKGIGDIAGLDLSRTDLSPEELGTIADSTYAKVAGKGSIEEVQDRKLFASGTAKQREFLEDVGLDVSASASAPAETAPEPPRADIPPELNDDILFEKSLQDPKVLRFLQRNNLSTDVLQTAIDGDYVDIPNRAAFDANIRRVARNYIDTRNELIAGPPPSTEKDKTGDTIGWSEATGISRERYKELLDEATKEFPDQALAYQPGAPGEEGTFTPNAATMLPTAVSEAEVPRDAQGRPIFTGMQAKINYDNFRALGEQGQREGIEMSEAINEARNQFAEDYLLPLTLGSLGVAGLPTVAAAGSSFAGTNFGTALGQVGRQFLSNQVVGPGATAASRLGALTTAAGVTKGIADATGVRTPFDDPNAEKQNAFQVANNPNLTGLQKAEYFAMLGIELAPAIFESPTMIRNIFRGKPGDFPGSYGSFLNARRSLINTADELGDAARAADDAFDTTQINRRAFKNTAAKAEAKAAQAEAKAAAKPTKANQNAAQKARAKADTAKSNDAVALRQQQADNARRLNARGRAGVADDELAAFNRRYNAPREPYNFGSTGFLSNTGNRIPAAVAGTGLLMNAPTEPALNTPDTVPEVQFVQPEIIPPTTTAPTAPETTTPTTPATPTPTAPDSDGDGVPDTIDVDAGTGTGQPTTKVDEQTSQDSTQTGFDMEGPGLLAAIPALASAASVGIQRRALNQMQAPQRPVLSNIPAFNYQSNLGQQLQDVRDSTQAMSRMDGVRGPQAAAARQGLLAQRLRQEQRLRGMDNQAMQQARARYDAMAQQARMAQDAIRTNYQNDLTQFNNQRAMLDAQIKQQPLNVLSATAQDYLKNVYQPNLAAQLEALGRQYDTTFPNQE